MDVIYNNTVTNSILRLEEKYGKLITMPRILLKETVMGSSPIPLDENNFSTYPLGNLLYQAFGELDLTVVIIDTDFSLDRRAGWWEDDHLFLLIAWKKLDQAFDTDKKIIDWLYRGLNHYRTDRAFGNQLIGKFSINRKLYEYDYIFKVFYELCTNDPNPEIAAEWWKQRGVYFYEYAMSEIKKARAAQYPIRSLIELFNSLIAKYDGSYEVVLPSVSIAFEGGFVSNMFIYGTTKEIREFTKRCFKSSEDLMKYVVFEDDGVIHNSCQIVRYIINNCNDGIYAEFTRYSNWQDFELLISLPEKEVVNICDYIKVFQTSYFTKGYVINA